MNEVLQQLHDRKSVRVYEDRPVEPEVKQAILEAAIQAPSAGNMALYTILDITDPEMKAKLVPAVGRGIYIPCNGTAVTVPVGAANIVVEFLKGIRRAHIRVISGGHGNVHFLALQVGPLTLIDQRLTLISLPPVLLCVFFH